MRAGNLVTLDVVKQGAIYHGLAALLAQPSPDLGGSGVGGGVNLRQMPSSSFGSTRSQEMSDRAKSRSLPPVNGGQLMHNVPLPPLLTGWAPVGGSPQMGPPNGYGLPPGSMIPQVRKFHSRR